MKFQTVPGNSVPHRTTMRSHSVDPRWFTVAFALRGSFQISFHIPLLKYDNDSALGFGCNISDETPGLLRMKVQQVVVILVLVIHSVFTCFYPHGCRRCWFEISFAPRFRCVVTRNTSAPSTVTYVIITPSRIQKFCLCSVRGGGRRRRTQETSEVVSKFGKLKETQRNENHFDDDKTQRH